MYMCLDSRCLGNQSFQSSAQDYPLFTDLIWEQLFYHDWQCGSRCLKNVQANIQESFVLLGNVGLFVHLNVNVSDRCVQPPSLSASLLRTHWGGGGGAAARVPCCPCASREQTGGEPARCCTPSSLSELTVCCRVIWAPEVFLSGAVASTLQAGDK